MDTQERIDALEDARERINEAVEIIGYAVRGTKQADRVRSYLISSLEMAASEDSQWLGGNMGNIDATIKGLKIEELESKMDDASDEEKEKIMEEVDKLERI